MRSPKEKTNTTSHTIHDIGLGAWFGGSLMGAIALNTAASVIPDPKDRARVVNKAWARWTPVNLAAIGAYVAGGAALMSGNRDRLKTQDGVAKLTMIKLGITGAAFLATGYARVIGQKMISAGDVPVEDGTTSTDETPEDITKAQRKLKMLQWAIPAHVGALIAISSRMSEQQRPEEVLPGMAKRLLHRVA